MATCEKSLKEEAIRLSDEIGVKWAAVQLGIPYWTLADWRERHRAIRGLRAAGTSDYRQMKRNDAYPAKENMNEKSRF